MLVSGTPGQIDNDKMGMLVIKRLLTGIINLKLFFLSLHYSMDCITWHGEARPHYQKEIIGKIHIQIFNVYVYTAFPQFNYHLLQNKFDLIIIFLDIKGIKGT